MGFLPCWDGGCYRIEAHCDGVRQCEDGADELGCKGVKSFLKQKFTMIFNDKNVSQIRFVL